MKLLFVTIGVPSVNSTGINLRNYHFLTALTNEVEIYLLCFIDNDINPGDYQRLQKICKKIFVVKRSALHKKDKIFHLIKSYITRIPRRIYDYYSNELRIKIKNIINVEKIQFIHCSTIFLIKNIDKQVINYCQIILDYNDCESLNLKRILKVKGKITHALLYPEYLILRNYEKILCEKFQYLTCVSEADAREIEQGTKNMGKIHNISVGVDVDYFKRTCEYKPMGSLRLIFTGQMTYKPNKIAVEILCEQIFPKVMKNYPDAQLFIVGANPDGKIRSYASEKIIVTGFVKDLREFFEGSTIFVCPLTVATGIQIKVLEAMAMGLPSIISECTFEGMLAKNNYELIVCRDIIKFSEIIVDLFEDKQKLLEISNNARNLMEIEYNWKNIETKTRNWYLDIMR